MKETSAIVDWTGRPIEKNLLTEEIAEAQLTGMRNVWAHQSVANFLNPTYLSSVIARANDGDHHEFLTMAEEMLERDLHFGSVVGTRVRALSGLDVEVTPASDDAADIKLADEIKTIIEQDCFSELVDGQLDALCKGYSVNEIIWETSARQWMPVEFPWRDPRFFNLDRTTGKELLLITDDNAIGEPLAAFKFCVHQPRLKMGLPIRGALARLAAVAYLCKGVALADWVTFAEIFGMPIRVGKYGRNATPTEKASLRNAVANLGSDASAIMPENMAIEFIEANRGAGGEVLYEKLCEYLDKQISKGVLGQTMTTDDGSSQSQANVHNDVRIDILQSDIKQLEATLKRDIVKPYIDLNYGPQKRYPTISFQIVEAEDINLLVDAVDKLVRIGFKVPAAVMHEKTGIREAKAGEDVLQAAPSAPASEKKDDDNTLGLNREQRNDDDLADYEDDWEDWEAQLAPIMEPILELAENSETEEQFRAGLPGLLETMQDSVLIDRLATALFKARGEGES